MILVLILLIILIGGSMKIKIVYKEANESSKLIKMRNHISIYLFGIRLKKIEINKKIHGSKNNNNSNTNVGYMLIKQVIKSLNNKDKSSIISKILKTFKIKKLDMDLGINLNDPIYNAYVIAFINAIVPLVLASKNTDLNNIRYTTFISNKTIFLNINCVISISLLKNIINILKVVLVIIKIKLKELKKNKCINKKKLIQKNV